LSLILALVVVSLVFVVRLHTQSSAVVNNASRSIYNSNTTNNINATNGSPTNNIMPLPPSLGNEPPGCADWYMVQYLREHGMWPPKAPIMLPMICWGPPLPPSVIQGMMSAAYECSSMGYEPLYYGNGYVVCINPKTFQTVSLPSVNWFLIVSTGGVGC